MADGGGKKAMVVVKMGVVAKIWVAKCGSVQMGGVKTVW